MFSLTQDDESPNRTGFSGTFQWVEVGTHHQMWSIIYFVIILISMELLENRVLLQPSKSAGINIHVKVPEKVGTIYRKVLFIAVWERKEKYQVRVKFKEKIWACFRYKHNENLRFLNAATSKLSMDFLANRNSLRTSCPTTPQRCRTVLVVHQIQQ